MSEDEKKAIEDIKLLSIGDFITWFTTDGIIKMGLSAKTVLNLIDKLQKENEDIKSRKEHQEKRFKKYKENIDKQHEDIYENLVSEKEKYVYLYQKALNNTIKSDRENIQLKKQIDLMARAFKQDDVRSVEEIKEYFEKQAKEKGEKYEENNSNN